MNNGTNENEKKIETKTFDVLKDLQTLLTRESSLKNVCKLDILYYSYQN